MSEKAIDPKIAESLLEFFEKLVLKKLTDQLKSQKANQCVGLGKILQQNPPKASCWH